MPDSVLVGLGPAEVDGLNQAARRHLVETGAVGGPAVEHQGRWLQAGDRVVTLRRLGPDLPPGRLRHVVTVDPATGGVLLTGDGRNNRVDRAAAAHLGYGYAVTPSLAATTDRALLVLGRADALGIHRGRVLLSTRDGPKPQRSIQRGLE